MVTLRPMSQSSERYPVVVDSFRTYLLTHTLWNSGSHQFVEPIISGFAASPTGTPFGTTLPMRGGRSGSGVSICENRRSAC